MLHVAEATVAQGKDEDGIKRAGDVAKELASQINRTSSPNATVPLKKSTINDWAVWAATASQTSASLFDNLLAPVRTRFASRVLNEEVIRRTLDKAQREQKVAPSSSSKTSSSAATAALPTTNSSADSPSTSSKAAASSQPVGTAPQSGPRLGGKRKPETHAEGQAKKQRTQKHL